MNFRLTKDMKLEKFRAGGLPFYYSDGWISNGKFLIDETLVKDSWKYKEPTTIQQPDFGRIIPHGTKGGRFFKTEWLFDHGTGFQRKYIAEVGDREIWIDEIYSRAFQIKQLYAEDEKSPCLAYNAKLLVMPMKSPEIQLKQKIA